MAREVLPAAEVPGDAPAADESGSRIPREGAPGDRLALTTFVAVEVVAFVVYLVASRGLWFFADEFEFLSARGVNVHDLLASHGGHLVALPVLVYRAMFMVFGLGSYRPYVLMSIVSWLVVAALLRAVMRRAGVGAWMATITASVYVFFGAAGNDILWGFQISFVGALAFGLAQLLLADHEGPLDRRDWLALAAGVASLLCSGVGVTMVAVVALATLARRGWRIAAFHSLPLAALYLAWWTTHDNGQSLNTDRGSLWRWDRRGLSATFDELGHVRYVGWLLGIVLIAGVVLAWRQRRGFVLLHTSAVLPFALFAGAIGFLTVTGMSRAVLGVDYSTSSRYLGIVAALVLPAIALAADAIARSGTLLAVAVGIVLLIGVPGNAGRARSTLPKQFSYDQTERTIRSLPQTDIAREVPRSLHPLPNTAPDVTVGWLLDTAAAGRLPAIANLTPVELATNRLRLAIEETSASASSTGVCRRVVGPVERVLGPGESFVVRGTVQLRLFTGDGIVSRPVLYGAGFETGHGLHRLRDVDGSLTLRIRPASPAPLVCA